jgi:hypothetical protein
MLPPRPGGAGTSVPRPAAWRELSSMPIRLAVSTVVPAPGTPTAGQASEWSRPSKKVAEPACKPGSVVDSHSSGRTVTGALEQPTRRRRGPRHCLPIWSCSRWGLPCRPVARLAVRSYRTISPLPAPCRPETAGPLAVSFCCTFRRLAPPRRYLAPCPVEPGLSSASFREGATTRLSGRLRRGDCRTTRDGTNRSQRKRANRWCSA